jgi:hypothetical protein
VTPEDVILDCYRLAKFYSRNPKEFLEMPISQIGRHLSWTAKLVDLMKPAEEDDDAS